MKSDETTDKLEQEQKDADILAPIRKQLNSMTQMQIANCGTRMALTQIIEKEFTVRNKISNDDVIQHLYEFIEIETESRDADPLITLFGHMCCSFYLIAQQAIEKDGLTIHQLQEHLSFLSGNKSSKALRDQKEEESKIVLLQ